MINYRTGNHLTVEAFVSLLEASTLGERRPIQDLPTIQAMLDHADVLVTAWDGEKPVGVARTLTDFKYIAYLSDLAVDTGYQRKGIGKELMRLTQEALEPSCSLLLLAAPAAKDYYAQFGMENHPRAWFLQAPSTR
ncbi:MAG: GNAT family N-acetyltransferase [Verrucomicrobiae bacterium]|nr:GNAT family N-acetyltransferase [Verrucomicrobiae bacterium]